MPFSYMSKPDPAPVAAQGHAPHPHSRSLSFSQSLPQSSSYPAIGGDNYFQHGHYEQRQQHARAYGAYAPSTPAQAALATASKGYHGGYAPTPTSVGDGMGNYYAYPPSASSNINDASLATATADASGRSGDRGGTGLFQMPSFLLGGLGTLAPGGGAEVLPSAGALPVPLAGDASPFDFNTTYGYEKPWRSTKYYTITEDTYPQQNARSPPAPTSTPVPVHEKQTTSPFGYICTEPQQEQEQSATRDEASVSAHDACPGDSQAAPPTPTDNASVDVPTAMSPGGLQLPHMHAPRASAPTAGIPIYSQSGFDMLSILGRVATRANPRIALGPVDLTCAFVVADVRRSDTPIVYASPTFCKLTGYTENEVLGRNCRFLQSPGGCVQRGDARRFTSPDSVRALRFAVQSDHEVQVSLINYRKDGRPFVNRLSIVPIPATEGATEIAYHVGFQVDLNEHPSHLPQRVQDGYLNDIGSSAQALTPAERSARGIGKTLRTLLADASFQSAVTLTSSCNNSQYPASSSFTSVPNSIPQSHSTADPACSDGRPDARDTHQWLHLLLLEYAPDFVHVLSLKGHFLYVSPGVARVLGYAPDELVGRCVGDFCHPSDLVPLLRELKEGCLASGHGLAPGEGQDQTSDPMSGIDCSSEVSRTQNPLSTRTPSRRTINLLFRMRIKGGAYAWIECLGRLHVEPGKGRKAIVLSGRTCAVPSLRWGAIERAGGLVAPVPSAVLASNPGSAAGSPTEGDIPQGPRGTDGCVQKKSLGGMGKVVEREREFWAMLCADGLFLVASAGVRDVLGWGAGEVIGRAIRDFVQDGDNSVPGQPDGGASVAQVRSAIERACTAEYDDLSASPGSNDSVPTSMDTDLDRTQKLIVCMKTRDSKAVWLNVVVFASAGGSATGAQQAVAQFKLLDGHFSSSTLPPSSLPCMTLPPGGYASQQDMAYEPSVAHSNHYTQSQSYADVSSFHPISSQHQQPSFRYRDSRVWSSGHILSALNANVFAELEPRSGSSWQYELQQLKFANHKLREEIAALEEHHRQHQRRKRTMQATAW
ncbi:hypothetical protein M0805_004931 [Coniferiporia weirii]|nr:hypothetical protein M0805_004931 [Coniferiporia weirii]